MDSHGHVTPRPDGLKARCGGPVLCPICQMEQAMLDAQTPQSPAGEVREITVGEAGGGKDR